MKQYILILGFCFCQLILPAQKSKIDSLEYLLQNTKHDTTRLQLYLQLSDACDINDNLKYGQAAVQIADQLLSQTKDSLQRNPILKQKIEAYTYIKSFYQNKEGKSSPNLLEYLQKTASAYQQIGDEEGIETSISEIAIYFRNKGEIMKQLEYLQQGLSLSEKMNHTNGKIRFLNSIAILYVEQGDTLMALDYLEKRTTIEKNVTDTAKIEKIFWTSAYLYVRLNRYDKAIEYYYKALNGYEAKRDTISLSNIYLELGKVYLKRMDLTKALENSEKSLSLSKAINYTIGTIQALLTTGDVYQQKGDIIKAIEYHKNGLLISEKHKQDYGILSACFTLSKDYLAQKNYPQAKANIDRSLVLAKKSGTIKMICETEKLAAKIDSVDGNFKEAYGHYQQYIILRDKLNDEEVRKSAQREKFQMEYEKQKAIDKAEQEKKDALVFEERKKQNIIVWSVASGLLLVALFAGFVFRSLRVTRKQKQIIEIKSLETEQQKAIIEEKNRSITDSIEYAKRIQQAKLPCKEEIYASLPNCFLLFQPKDIVSGDFYFFHKNDKSVFIAAADCTGHGVPGALVSMIGSEKLEDAVSQSRDTSEILKYLNKGIKTALRQSESDDSTRDGMDIALCCLDTESQIVKYAGANRPLWLIRNGQATIEEIKATKRAIGGLTEDEQYFETHELKLQQGDTFYIFTDGYADQFSGKDEKKLMTKGFKEILLGIQHKTMHEQEKHLSNFIESWKAGIEQVDDILVIGVRL